jgi:hypothetical protein
MLDEPLEPHIERGRHRIDSDRVTLHIEGGRATFGAAGIELTPWFTRHRLQIPWANVMFVSPVPAVRRNGGEWHTYRREHITPTKLRSTLRFYCFEVALYARADLLAPANFFTRMWLLLTVWLKPLYVADDKPHPSNGCIKLYLRKRWLRKNGSSLLSALDIVERFSKFDLLTHLD